MVHKKDYYIKSVIKSLNILNLFSNSRYELSISEISKKLDLGISTTYRLLGTLKYKNYIEQNPQNLKYKLGYAFLNKAFLVSNNEANIIKKSMSYLENLRTNIEIGKKLPAYKTALGKILLAYLSPEKFIRLFKLTNDNSELNIPDLKQCLKKVKAEGIAFDNEEATPGTRCMAAP